MVGQAFMTFVLSEYFKLYYEYYGKYGGQTAVLMQVVRRKLRIKASAARLIVLNTVSLARAAR